MPRFAVLFALVMALTVASRTSRGDSIPRRNFTLRQPTLPQTHIEHRLRPELVGMGFAVFGTAYTLSLAAATIGSSESVKDCPRPSKRDCPNTLSPLFFPVIGPFWMMGNVSGGKRGDYLVIGLAVDGLAQLSGLAAMVLGFVPQAVIVKNGDVSIGVSPLASPSGGGFGLSGVF